MVQTKHVSYQLFCVLVKLDILLQKININCKYLGISVAMRNKVGDGHVHNTAYITYDFRSQTNRKQVGHVAQMD